MTGLESKADKTVILYNMRLYDCVYFHLSISLLLIRFDFQDAIPFSLLHYCSYTFLQISIKIHVRLREYFEIAVISKFKVYSFSNYEKPDQESWFNFISDNLL